MCILDMASDYHQDAHMPAMGMLQRAAVVQTPTVEPIQVKMTSKLEPQNRIHILSQTQTFIDK